MRYSLSTPQQNFVICNDKAKAIIGGLAVGKTTALCIDIIRNIIAGIPIVIIVPNYIYQKNVFEPALKDVANAYNVDISKIKFITADKISGGRYISYDKFNYIYIPSLARTFPCGEKTSSEEIDNHIKTLNYLFSRFHTRADYNPGYFIEGRFTNFLDKHFSIFRARFNDNAINMPKDYSTFLGEYTKVVDNGKRIVEGEKE